MRMALCWPSLFLLCILFLFPSSTCADAPFTLSDELTNFIPPCAQTCFLNFIEDNFPTSTCTSNPTLDCLCSTNSTGGYTVGEGAIQCIISEINIGFCQGVDATDTVATNAFFMCNGQASALPNTHGTITATLIVETSNPSIVFIAPPATQTSSTPSIPSSSSTTSPISTSSSSSRPTTSLLVAPSTTTSKSSRTSSTSTSSPTPAAPAADKAAITTALSKNQVVAISVSAAGGAILLIGLCVLFACVRRRRQKIRDSDMIPFQADPEFRTPMEFQQKRGRLSTGLPPRDPTQGFRTPMEIRRDISAKGKAIFPLGIRREISAKGKGGWAQVPPQVPPRLETSDPQMFARRSVRPDTIGLAISPERNPTMEVMRSSPLLPEKPYLSLNTNTAELAGSSIGHRTQAYPSVNRESMATQFEEDDDSIMSRASQRYSEMMVEWQGLAPAPPQTMEPPVPSPKPQSQFVVNSGENHYPHYQGTVTAPDYSVKPLSFSRPITSGTQLQPPPRQSSQNPGGRPLTGGSSVHSQASAVPYKALNTGKVPSSSNSFKVTVLPMAPGSQTRQPSQSQYEQGKGQGKPQGQVHQVRQGRSRASEGSLTSFDSASPVETLNYRNTLITGADLSPVAESVTESPTGVSPVSYPKIKRLSSQLQLQKSFRMVPPPPQPDFMSVFSSGVRKDDVNRSGRANGNGNGIGGGYGRWNGVKASNGEARREPLNTGEAAARAAEMNRRLSRSQALALPPPSMSLPRTPPRTPPRQQNLQNKPKLASPFQPLQAPPNQQQLTPPTSLFSTHTHKSTNSLSSSFSSSTSSSLLAKRLGDKRANELLITTTSPTPDKWRVLNKEDQERARQAGWKPMLSLGLSAGGVRNGGGGATGGSMWSEDMELPKTPGWVPKLTPTRRGDEMFLSVA